MTKRPMLALAAASALAFAAYGSGEVAAAQPVAGAAGCVLAGPKYTHAGLSTTKYNVAVYGVTCSYAKTWVARLLTKHPVRKVVNGQVVGSVPGPPGWQCNTWNPSTGRGVPKGAYAGACAPTASGVRKKFAWEPIS
jgi:hypothetical protein